MLKATLKEVDILINNNTFLVDEPEKGYPVTPCMDVYQAKIQSDRSLDKLKFRIVVRVYIQDKDSIGDTCSSTASVRTLKYFLVDAGKHKSRVHQLDFIG